MVGLFVLAIVLAGCSKSGVEPSPGASSASASAPVSSPATPPGASGTSGAGARATPSAAGATVPPSPLVLAGTPQPFKHHTITASACELPGSLPTGSDPEHVVRAIELVADRLLVIDGAGVARVFRDGPGPACALTELPRAAQPEASAMTGEVTWLSRNDRGDLLVSQGPSRSVLLRKGSAAPEVCEAPGQGGRLAIDPDGNVGLSPQPGGKVTAVTFAKTGCKVADWPMEMQGGFASVTWVGFRKGNTFVAGRQTWEVMGEHPTILLALSGWRGDGPASETFRAGKLQPGVSDESFGEIRAMASCGPRMCVLDDGLARLSLRDMTGLLLGVVDLRKLLGLAAPRFPALAFGASGVGYLLVTEPDAAGRARGAIVRLAGFGPASAVTAPR